MPKKSGQVVLLVFGIVLFGSAPAFAALGASVTVASGQPTSIYPGETTQLQITLSNSNEFAAITGVAFSNSLPGTLPNGLKISGAATYTCTDPSGPTVNAGAGVLTAVVGTQAIDLTGGVIPARASSTDGTCTIIIPVTAGSSTGNAATHTYSIVNGAVTGNDGGAVANSGLVSQSINVTAVALPVITKSFGSSTLVLGGSSTTLTITVSNSNPVAIPNFDITDNFPQLAAQAIIQVAATPAETSTCTGAGVAATFAPNAGDTSVTATGGTIAANGSCTITVAVSAKHTNSLYETAFQTNTITGATDFTNDLGLIPANATAQIRTRSPLNVAKAFANSPIADGQSSTFTITWTNTSSSALVVNSFTDDPIDGINDPSYGLILSADPTAICTGAGVAGTFVRINNDEGFQQTADTTIAAGGSCTITGTFVGTVQAANTPISVTNTIAAGAVGTATAGVVSQAASATVIVADTLRVLKSATPTTAAPGNPVKYTVTVQNWSAGDFTNAVITDVLANSQTFLTGTIGGINFSPVLSGTGCVGLAVNGAVGAAAPEFTIGTVPQRSSPSAPGSCSVEFYAMSSTAAGNGSALTNTIAVGGVCANAGAVCNGSGVSSTAGSVVSPVVTATKSFTPAGPLAEGAVSTMRITLTNRSANPLTSVSISDTLPTDVGGGQLRVSSSPNAASTCGTPTITAVADATSISMSGATVPARASGGLGASGSCFIQVDVVGPAGSYANTASVAATETYADGTTAAVGPLNSNTATLVYTSALSATKSFSPTTVSSGGKSRVTVRLSNSSAGALTGISVVDPLPAGMVLANPVNAATTCAGSTNFVGAAGAGSITMTGAELAGNGTCDMLFDVVATGAANWTNTIPVGNIDADNNISNQVAVSSTLNFAATTALTVAKATNPSTLTFPGQVSELTITISTGAAAVTNMSLTDYFTADGTSGAAANGMKIAPSHQARTTCSGGIVTATPGGTSVSMTGASLGANSSCTIIVNVTSITVGGITNYIPISAISTSQGLTNSGQGTTSLTTQSNVGIAKQFTPNVVKPGERSRLRITLYNPTVLPVSNLSVTDTLPAGVVVPAGPNPTTTCSGATVSAPTTGSVQISGANIVAASGVTAASCYAEIDVEVALQGDYVNTIPINAITATVGGAPVTNSQPTTDTLRAKLPIVIHKAIDSKTLDTGNPVGFTTGTASAAVGAAKTMTISITNPNDADLTRANLTDDLPAGLVIATTPNASTTCASGVVSAPASGTSVVLTGATLAHNAACTVSVDVLSNISGSYTNTIAASSVNTLEGVTNEEPTSARLAVSTPPTVTKQFVPPVIGAGGTSTMTIFLGNSNTSALTLTSALVDNLPVAPGDVLVAGTPNVVKTCPGAVTAVAGAATVTYANGAQIPAGGCTISVDVTASTAGVHTNNIPAGSLTTDLGDNQDPANATLTVSPLGFISGKVFKDNDVTPNGTFLSGTDTPIDGVSIELRGGATCAAALITSQNTDAAGNYIFSGLAAGTYSVCEPIQPTGTINGITTAGGIIASNGSTGTAGTASNPTATTSQIIGIVLNNDGGGGEISGSTNNNFAEVIPSTISGRVFLDQNNNGVQNGVDDGIAGVTIELLDNGGATVTTTTTDALGDYSFTNLSPETYSVREPTQPAGSANGITTPGTVGNGGTAGTATGVLVVPSRINTIILPPNTTAADNNFAEIPEGRTVSGTVFFDYNNNGVMNGVDYGISGVTINLTGTDVNGNAVSETTTTASDGTYSFSSVPEGTYTIDEPGQPTGTTNGTTTAGSTGGAASNPTATSSRILNLDLTTTNTISAGNDFAEVPGAVPDLTITKTHSPSSFGENSSTGYFTLTPGNIGNADTSGTITVTDTLPAGMTIAAVPTGTGWTCTGSVGGSAISCTSTDVIVSGGTGNAITLRVLVADNTAGQLLVNTTVISGGNEPPGYDGNNTDTDTVAISTTANVSGTVWRDTDHDRMIDGGETLYPDWKVELVLGGVTVYTTTTAIDGTYAFTDVSPGSGYQIRFREPTTNMVFGKAVTNEQGIAPVNSVRDSGSVTANNGTNAGNPAGADLSTRDGTLRSMTLLAGDNIVEQSLPLDPAGVVYNSITREPVEGAVVTISSTDGGFDATDLVGGSLTVTTAADGFYQFLLLPTAPAATYTLTVTTYPPGYKPLPSDIIDVCNNTITADAAPDPALIQTDATAPIPSAPIHDPSACPAATGGLAPGNQASTQYYFSFVIDPLISGDIVNNHIPLDPQQAGDIVVTKMTPLVNVSVGQLVPYTITVQNISVSPYSFLDVSDVLPPGFKYVTGSASRDGIALEPEVSGLEIVWPDQTLAAGQTKTFKFLAVVGSGVQPGEYVNTAFSLSSVTNAVLSNLATATVRVIPDPLFDCSEIIGKVFDDRNANGYQDNGEPGIPNVRVVTVTGLLVTTDTEGRFHVACAAIPDSEHGSNFVMKLDERTLPTGYRVTTENPRDVRVTRGKMVKLNFGAAIHKMIRIDMRDDAFEKGSAELKPEWKNQIAELPEKLNVAATVARLSYSAANEDLNLARRRLTEAVNTVKKLWKNKDCCRNLLIEEEFVALPADKTEGGAA